MNLKYAAWNGSSWDITTVDSPGDVGQYASLKLKGNGDPRIAYYDAASKDLKYVEWNGAWGTPHTLDSTGDVGQYASLALDPDPPFGDSHPCIAYYDATGGNLKYAELNTSIWVVMTVDAVNDVGQYASLAVDAAHKMKIAYYNATSQDLLYISEQ